MGGMALRKLAVFAAAAVLVLAVSQVAGYLVRSHLDLHETYVVNGVLHLTRLENTGAVFGLFPGNSWLFALTSSLTILVVCAYLLRSHVHAGWQYACLGCIAGAAASNVCDRLMFGAVIDYIDIQGVPYWRYVFNVADAAIHVGAWPLLIGSAFGRTGPGEAGPREAGLDRDRFRPE
jgi:signal peptidase II